MLNHFQLINVLLMMMNFITSCPSSLQSQLSDSFRVERLHSGGRGVTGISGSSASLYGSLPRQAPPPVLPSKPFRDVGVSAGPAPAPQTHTVQSLFHNSNPVLTASPRLGRSNHDGSVRRGSFVERCQELAKGSEAAGGLGFGVLPGSDSMRRSLAVCNELEARFGLRIPTTFSVLPGARCSPGTPSSSSSSSSHHRAATTSPTSPALPPAVSPARPQAPVSPRHGAAASPADVPASPESPASPDSPTSPKPHISETSF